MKRNKQMKKEKMNKKIEIDETDKKYIPMDEAQNHDLFIDLLSYGRQSFSNRNDIWTYAYV